MHFAHPVPLHEGHALVTRPRIHEMPLSVYPAHIHGKIVVKEILWNTLHRIDFRVSLSIVVASPQNPSPTVNHD